MSNQSHTIYAGSTIDLLARVRQHEEKRFKKAFTARHHFTRLVYFEVLPSITDAEAREMEIRDGRAKKVP
jgi:predicted GIY-YIG superfamily endonuclease